MPRVTRAALRSQELQQEASTAASVPLPLTPKLKDRAPLGETSGNRNTPTLDNTGNEIMATDKKGPGRKKYGNTTKKASKTKDLADDSAREIAEDDNQSQTSSAAEEACNDLLKETSPGIGQVAVDEERAPTPESAAVVEARLQLSPQHTTPSANPKQQPDVTASSDSKTKEEDSFVANIKTRTPAKMNNPGGPNPVSAKDGEEEDSFLEQIKTRTPGRRISRIEDSVEALDALEDDIEMVGGLIPNTENPHSCTKPQQQVRSTQPTSVKRGGSAKVMKPTTASSRVNSRKPITNTRLAASRSSMQPPTKAIKPARPSTHNGVSEKCDTAVGKLDSTPSQTLGPSGAPLKKRVSSIHKAPFQPVKSMKPPTRASFELPGDAVARKLKEQREERLQREGQEKKPEQPTFKARPIRLSHAPDVKLTAATKARLSMAKGEPANSTATTTSLAPRHKAMARGPPVTLAGTNKRLSSLSVAKRSTNTPAAVAPRNRRVSGEVRAAPTGNDLANQKVKGKEVFGRTKVEILERERIKREKDEAIKKARAEAAERGRAASRNWAEKQKLRKMEAVKVNGESMIVER